VLHEPLFLHCGGDGQVTAGPDTHVPAASQLSFAVHAFPSLQEAGSETTGFEQLPVPVLHVPAAWHWSSGVQTTGFEPVHAPDWQVSVCVHWLPSEQDEPSLLFGLLQAPVAGLQVPTSWHWSRGVHTTALEPVHTPDWQASSCVQRSLSLHTVPFARGVVSHAPFVGLQTPRTQGPFNPVQLIGVTGLQRPLPRSQVSLPLHGLPSWPQSASLKQPHWEPSCWQPSGSEQVSMVQSSKSSQPRGSPPHTPPVQKSDPPGPVVHAEPSSHSEPFDLFGLLQRPLPGSHVPALWHWSSAVQTTGLVPVQTPVWQVSVWVQLLPSLQLAPSTLFGLLHVPSAGSQTPWSWQPSRAEQATGFDPTHEPPWHVSVWVQLFPSEHGAPSDFVGLLQRPVDGSQAPALWQASEAVHVVVVAPVHAPAWQVSDCVHKSLSLQTDPFDLFGLVHKPVAESQVPATWHWSSALQVTNTMPVHTPLRHTSVVEQESPSLHGRSSAALGLLHWPVEGLQVPATWHWSSGLQVTGLPPVQTPVWHVSAVVQPFPSLHGVPFGLFGSLQRPVAGSQTPGLWQLSSAVHVTALVPKHTPPWHESASVHALLSLHGAPSERFGLLQVPVDGLQVPALWHWSSAVQTIGLVPVQTPSWHVSVCEHKLPSLHTVPSAAGGLLQTPVPGLQLPATWQASEAVHTTGVAPTHVPAWHVSERVQALLSLQVAPSVFGGLVQRPVPGSQTPTLWQVSRAVQVRGLDPTQNPLWHVSVWVHMSPSLQTAPFDLIGLSQAPVALLHEPGRWQSSSAVQVTGFEPVQVPDWQVSVWVHALLSLHDAPSALFGFEHWPFAGLQTPGSRHWLSAVHTTGFAPTQLPAEHVSVCVQAFPSLHDVPLPASGLLQSPVPGSQMPAIWQPSSGMHTTGLEPVQTPSWQLSVWVQGLPSSHGVPSTPVGLLQAPVDGSHVPGSWHASDELQLTGSAPVQRPAWQVSVCVQRSPSMHGVPSAELGSLQIPVAGSQMPASWHWSSAMQTMGFAPAHVPFWHVSVWVQTFASLHTVPFALFGLVQIPVDGSQTPATWHWSSAAHGIGTFRHWPLVRNTSLVQRFPSSQGEPESVDASPPPMPLPLLPAVASSPASIVSAPPWDPPEPLLPPGAPPPPAIPAAPPAAPPAPPVSPPAPPEPVCPAAPESRLPVNCGGSFFLVSSPPQATAITKKDVESQRPNQSALRVRAPEGSPIVDLPWKGCRGRGRIVILQ
jgi:hypothetical protein